ncbi:MAG TPA: DUF2282 domain-containing protein [Gammaproteobacteria bacterium]|nr:DUF2282 domain-containing protein [Gammaproteobacteria bacterium]
MRDTRLIMSAALTGLVALAGTSTPAMAADHASMQKCYGINKAHMNDCASADHGCKGMATKARDPQSYVYVPKGVCQKIAGGSTTAGKSGSGSMNGGGSMGGSGGM